MWSLEKPSVRHNICGVKVVSFYARGNYVHIKSVRSVSQLPVSYCLGSFDYAAGWTIWIKNPNNSRRILSSPKHLEQLCNPPSLQRKMYIESYFPGSKAALALG
jgi:hypothetical protein